VQRCIYWNTIFILCLIFRIHGFPNNLATYGMVSGLWTSTFALGSFIGPSVAGVMYDYVGFEYSTLFVVVFNFALVSVVVIQVRRQDNFTFFLSFSAPLCFCAWSGGRLSVYRLLQKPLLDTVRWMLELAKILM
jgi:hypothetical protein